MLDNDSTNFLKTVSLCGVCLCNNVLSFQPFAYSVAPHCPMTGWVCQWKPFWIPVDDSFKKAYVEEWVFLVNATSERSNSESQGDVIPETPEVSMPVSSSPWGPPKNQDTACSWERIEAPLPPLQPRSTCERLELPFSCDAILSGYEDLVSSGSDQFTMWDKMSPQEILAEHVVDIHKVVADFRDAFERIQSSPSQSYGVNKYFSSQSPVQKRLSIYNWNPGIPGVERKTLLRNKLRRSGILLLCKGHLIMSNTICFKNDFT